MSYSKLSHVAAMFRLQDIPGEVHLLHVVKHSLHCRCRWPHLHIHTASYRAVHVELEVHSHRIVLQNHIIQIKFTYLILIE